MDDQRIQDLEQITSGFMEQVEARLEALDRLHASLSMGYMELASALEVLISDVMSPRPEEEREEFRNKVADMQQQALSALQKLTAGINEKSPAPAPLDETLEQVAQEHLNNYSGQ